MNLLSGMLLVEINKMLSSVALSSCVIVTTTPLTSLRVVMSIIFLVSVLVVARTLAFLKILLLPFPLEIPFEFLATEFFIIILSIEMYFRQRCCTHRVHLMILC
jgi:hypothetical protein